ncbi:MAG: LuxR C-terminal-related transcriptional regulator [Nitrospira sp.]|nr:LuxR C-terminal-related transcriptional regulator [Nitrospira sp.]MDH4303976.1 LuxR C-terminal-related transcriptional regulator [Nitrospira sp.]MDH5194946.1 LuxR C-terminal-related transcriptional regulator [Nitrospira sp.]
MARHSTTAKKTAATKYLSRTVRHAKASVSITPRQREILRLVALGHTNREIAGSLGISVRTVEVHRFNLMRRLNVRNVAQLLRQALQQNLLPRNFGTK